MLSKSPCPENSHQPEEVWAIMDKEAPGKKLTICELGFAAPWQTTIVKPG